MINIKHLLVFLLLLPVVSCEQRERPEAQPEEGSPISFLLDTKALGGGDRTYRVVLTNESGALKGSGTYCSQELSSEAMGYSWLSPCRVNNAGEPLMEDGSTVAASFDEADKKSIYGLRYATNSGRKESLRLAVASPAVALNASSYYEWTPDKALYLSNSVVVDFEGSWANYEYVLSSKEDDRFQLIDRRAKLFVHIECGEQPTADLQSVTLSHVKEARWYPVSGFSSSGYTIGQASLFTCGGETSNILHLVKNSVSWDSPEEGQYILPLDYSAEEFSGMRPRVIVELGSNLEEPVKIPVSISEKIDPMKSYKLTLKVSKSHAEFILLASDWEEGGTDATDDEEKWATLATGVINHWDKLEDETSSLTTDDWNDSWN